MDLEENHEHLTGPPDGLGHEEGTVDEEADEGAQSESSEDSRVTSPVQIVNNEEKGAGPTHMSAGDTVTCPVDDTVIDSSVDFTADDVSTEYTETLKTDDSFPNQMFEDEDDTESQCDTDNPDPYLDKTSLPKPDLLDSETVQEEQPKKKIFNIESLSYELQVGYRILSNLMSSGNRCVNKLFLYPVDDSYPETANYYEKIKAPMCMNKSKISFSLKQSDTGPLR